MLHKLNCNVAIRANNLVNFVGDFSQWIKYLWCENHDHDNSYWHWAMLLCVLLFLIWTNYLFIILLSWHNYFNSNKKIYTKFLHYSVFYFISKTQDFCLLLYGFNLFLPPVWGPQAWSRPLGVEQLHGRYRVSEKVAEAEHGTDQHTRRSSAILRHTETNYYDYYKFTENIFYADFCEK